MARLGNLFAILLLTCVVFAIGVILGNAWKDSGSTEAAKVLRTSELDAESFLVEQELFSSFETNCALAQQRVSSLSLELYNLGKVLGTDDAQATLGDQDYNYLKRKYHLMQIRTYILEKTLQTDCGNPNNVILYYYQQNDTASLATGKLLDSFVREYPVHVFAIEYRYSKELQFLEDYYEISRAPALVVNFKTVLYGPVSPDTLRPLLQPQTSPQPAPNANEPPITSNNPTPSAYG